MVCTIVTLIGVGKSVLKRVTFIFWHVMLLPCSFPSDLETKTPEWNATKFTVIVESNAFPLLKSMEQKHSVYRFTGFGTWFQHFGRRRITMYFRYRIIRLSVFFMLDRAIKPTTANNETIGESPCGWRCWFACCENVQVMRR